jgi:phospholipid/cholesterol/gamma-HCH transport system substrate-binding protein
MKNKTIDNTKVGLLVISGLIFLVLTLYMIGKNRNLLGATFTVKAVLTNVNGLVPGNNVRFRGLNVGTVKKITIASDTTIFVTMTIDESMKPFIKKNVVASVGTDGLMGDKLININSPGTPAEPIAENDTIRSLKPIETDEMLRTLNTTNTNIERISANLYEITTKLNSSESLWSLLSDTTIAKNLKGAVRNFKDAGANTADMTLTARNVVREFDQGNGIVYRLFADTSLSNKLDFSLGQIRQASMETSTMMKDLKQLVGDVQQGEGTAGLILKDTMARQSLMRSVQSIEQGADRFNENMEALKSNFLFRGYFRRQKKKQTSEEAGKN